MSELKPKIIHVIKGLGRGGAEQLVLSQVTQHDARYSYEIVYFLPFKNQLVSEFECAGCTVTCLNASSSFQVIFKLGSLVKLFRNKNVFLIHAHLPISGIVARLAGRILSIPVVYTEHNVFNHYNFFTKLVSRWTYGYAAKVVAVSYSVKNSITNLIPTNKIEVIPNAVDLNFFDRSKFSVDQLRNKNSLNTKSKVIISVSSIRPQKRLDRWIDIANQVCSQLTDAVFIYVGAGSVSNDLKSKIQFPKRIRFVGIQPHPEEWLACADIYLITSDYEGMPVALLEAMSMGCVPVVTHVGGIPEIVEDSVNGFLFSPKETKVAVKKICDLLNMVDLQLDLAKNARFTVENHFSITQFLQRLNDLYQEVTSPK